MSTSQWHDQQIVIIGAARQGLALTRFFLLRGANVILNDRNDENALENVINDMETWKKEHAGGITGNLTWVLGKHPESILEGTDLMCISGGVPLEIPIIVAAQKRGIPLTNDSELFMQAVKCPVIGITGSAGKTTTTSLLGEILTNAIQTETRKVWVGGNIGIPLIEKIDEIRPDDLVLLELSSFQLDLMKTVPHIGAILNITPNHLDRHGTMEAYTQAKLNLFRYQSEKDIAIINHDDPGTWRERDLIPGTMATFGFQRCRLPIIQAYQKEDQLILNDGQRDFFLFNVNDIKLRGKHNILNVMAACVTAYCAGVPLTELRETVRHFKGVSHRLEFIRHYKGVSWFNDSIATSPERSMAAIRSFAEPLVVLLGGRDKDLPWENLAKLIHRRVHDVILFGEAADMIEPILKEHRCASSLVHITKCNTLHDAVLEAKKVAQNGDVVLLSPGGTSFDEFERFRRARRKVQRMGTTNFVKATPTVNQQTKKLRRMRFKVDIPLLITVAVLLIFGLIMVYSSSMAFSIRDTDDNTPYFFFNRQLRFMVMGIVVCFVASRFNYHWLKPLAPFILGAVLVMLFAVLFMPQSADTPKRGLLGGSVQPSELAKVAIVIYLAVWIGKKKEQLNSIISGLLPLGVILGITIILIVAEPDISAMLTVLALGGLLFYVGDGDWRIILGFAVLGLVAFGLTFFVFKALDIHYIQERLDSFKLGGTNMNDIHPHIQHSLAAVVRGVGLALPWVKARQNTLDCLFHGLTASLL